MTSSAKSARVLRHGSSSSTLGDRTLPHSLDAEPSVLGAIIVNNTLLADADLLSKDDFYRDAHQRVFSSIRALAGEGVVIDLVSLRDELHRRGDLDEVGGPAYIASLVDGVPRGTNVQHYARVVRNAARFDHSSGGLRGCEHWHTRGRPISSTARYVMSPRPRPMWRQAVMEQPGPRYRCCSIWRKFSAKKSGGCGPTAWRSAQ